MLFFIILCVLVAQHSHFANGDLQFTNVVCKVTDPDFCNFEYCFIKAVNRSFKYLSIKVNLYRIPITNVSVQIDIQKKGNGYKPFLYNITFDACKFLKSRNNPLYNYFFSFVEKHSNVNHRCPFDHDLIFEKIPSTYINNLMTIKLPVPDGEYVARTTWIAYNVPRATVDIFVKLA